MAVLVQTRTFFILAAVLGRFVAVKAQEVEEYEGGEFLSASKTIIIIPLLCMQCVYSVIWLVSGAENLWDTRVRLLLSHIEKGAERGLRFGFLSGRPRFAALAAGTEREGRSKAKCCRGALRLSPCPGGAAAAGKFRTKERAWDAAGGQLGERAGSVNTEASQGGVVSLNYICFLTFFVLEKCRNVDSLFSHPSPSSFAFSFLSFSGSFSPRLLRRGCLTPRMAQNLPSARGQGRGAAAARGELRAGRSAGGLRASPARPALTAAAW